MVDAQIMLAAILMENGESKMAIQRLLLAKKAAFASPLPSQLIQIGLRLARLQQFDEVHDILHRLSENENLIGESLSLRGYVAEIQGNLSDAIDLYRKALAHGASNNIKFMLANALREAGFIEAAIAELSAIGKENSNIGINSRFLLARIYVDTTRYNEAARELMQILKLDIGLENKAYVYTELGYVYKAQELFEAAIACYEKVLVMKPGDLVALEGLNDAKERQIQE